MAGSWMLWTDLEVMWQGSHHLTAFWKMEQEDAVARGGRGRPALGVSSFPSPSSPRPAFPHPPPLPPAAAVRLPRRLALRGPGGAVPSAQRGPQVWRRLPVPRPQLAF